MLRRDHDDAVRAARAVDRAGRRALEHLDVGDVFGIQVGDTVDLLVLARRDAAAGAGDRVQTDAVRVVVDDDAVDDVEREIRAVDRVAAADLHLHAAAGRAAVLRDDRAGDLALERVLDVLLRNGVDDVGRDDRRPRSPRSASTRSSPGRSRRPLRARAGRGPSRCSPWWHRPRARRPSGGSRCGARSSVCAPAGTLLIAKLPSAPREADQRRALHAHRRAGDRVRRTFFGHASRHAPLRGRDVTNANEKKQNRDELRDSSHVDPHTLELLKGLASCCPAFVAMHALISRTRSHSHALDRAERMKWNATGQGGLECIRVGLDGIRPGLSLWPGG